MSALSFVSIPKKIHEISSHPSHLGWKQVMINEMIALDTHTWEFVPPRSRKYVIGYWWVFDIKVRPNGHVWYANYNSLYMA